MARLQVLVATADVNMLRGDGENSMLRTVVFPEMDGSQYLLRLGGALGLNTNSLCHLMVMFILQLNFIRYMFYNVLYLFVNKESRY